MCFILEAIGRQKSRPYTQEHGRIKAWIDSSIYQRMNSVTWNFDSVREFIENVKREQDVGQSGCEFILYMTVNIH